MKKLITGVIIGCALSTGTFAFADSNTVNAILYPVKYVFDGKETQLPDEYVTLNYNGHAYVPVRFIAENMNSAVVFDPENNTVMIDSSTHSDLTLMDPKEERVRVGELKLTYANGKTTINGKIQVIGGEQQNTVRGTKLNFTDLKNTLLAEVFITEPDGSSIQVNKNEVKEFTITTEGDITGYKNVTLTVGMLNEVKNVRPQIIK